MTAQGPAPDVLATSLRGARVLIVDDDPLQCSHLAQVMKEWDAEPFTAQSLADALRLHKEARPDLVLLDVMMPHVDGWEMLRQIQERFGLGSIPVLMFSGQVDEAGERQATSSGARGFVGKGFDLDELVDQAKAILPL